MSEKFEKGRRLIELHLGRGGLESAVAASPELPRFVTEHGFAD